MGTRTWQWYLGACSVTAATYVLLPWMTVKLVVALCLHLSAATAITQGVRRHRPAVRRPWYALACGVALYTAADLIHWRQSIWLKRDTFPSLADALYIPSTLALIAGLIGFAAARRFGWDRAALIDTAIVSSGTAVLAWVYLISPTEHSADLSLLGRSVAAAYPCLALLALALLMRLSLGTGWQIIAYRLLVAGVATLLITDVLYTLLELQGHYAAGGPLDVGWMASNVLMGAAALHPSMPDIALAGTSHNPSGVLSTLRLYGLAAAILTAPLLLIIEWLRRELIDIPVIAASSIALCLLVLTRLHDVVGQLSQLLDIARTQANTDQLTGLANRRFFHTQWQQQLGGPSSPTALLYLDLDGFKAVNDTLGHEAGDAVLQIVADRIRQIVRAGDVVARLGGDEFAVILPGATDEHAELIATRILNAISAPMTVHDAPADIGASIGVVLAPSGADPDTEIQRADAAMYTAKNSGRNRIHHV